MSVAMYFAVITIGAVVGLTVSYVGANGDEMSTSAIRLPHLSSSNRLRDAPTLHLPQRPRMHEGGLGRLTSRCAIEAIANLDEQAFVAQTG